ncbi:MAG: hypothetical protein NOF05_02000 [Candidatus Accumulibacter phosphatis]|uniref:Uncharacterized protein n=1 Tax=Candidatus Thiothrix phosphatis TaxID=3112415 RepID=A0ABU6D2S8_9GAMM|nr:hypothetical protein [Candidatus Thiothrix sp. Deng01]MCQ1547606.1 hypothetical protein [Candidatus Accumulibacter phosphatis]MEB4593385.1 hypothetical protein [Candidatus Thiothrix sp. Deng01]
MNRRSWFGLVKLILTLAGSAATTWTWAQATQVDVTSQVTLTRSGYVYNRSTNTFDSTVRLSGQATSIPGPISYVITGIDPASVTLSNAAGTTPDGKPYVKVPVAAGGLEAGQSVSVVVKFANPSREKFSYTYQVLSRGTDIGKYVSFGGPPPILAELDALPRDPDTGLPVLIGLAEGSLQVDATLRDPITAVGACTGWITACLKPGERELDDCARSAPQCATNTPWLESSACCPAACFAQYRTARLAGMPQIATLMRVYVNDGSCFPQYKGRR